MGGEDLGRSPVRVLCDVNICDQPATANIALLLRVAIALREIRDGMSGDAELLPTIVV